MGLLLDGIKANLQVCRPCVAVDAFVVGGGVVGGVVGAVVGGVVGGVVVGVVAVVVVAVVVVAGCCHC